MDDSQGNKAHPVLDRRNADIRIDKAVPTGDHISQHVTALLVAACTTKATGASPMKEGRQVVTRYNSVFQHWIGGTEAVEEESTVQAHTEHKLVVQICIKVCSRTDWQNPQGENLHPTFTVKVVSFLTISPSEMLNTFLWGGYSPHKKGKLTKAPSHFANLQLTINTGASVQCHSPQIHTLALERGSVLICRRLLKEQTQGSSQSSLLHQCDLSHSCSLT